MKYHALFVIFEKAETFEMSSAANYRWRFMGYNCSYKVFTQINNGL